MRRTSLPYPHVSEYPLFWYSYFLSLPKCHIVTIQRRLSGIGIFSYPPGKLSRHSSSLYDSLSSILVRAQDNRVMPCSLTGMGVAEQARLTVTVSVRCIMGVILSPSMISGLNTMLVAYPVRSGCCTLDLMTLFCRCRGR